MNYTEFIDKSTNSMQNVLQRKKNKNKERLMNSALKN